jgi:hypothetical protein
LLLKRVCDSSGNVTAAGLREIRNSFMVSKQLFLRLEYRAKGGVYEGNFHPATSIQRSRSD